MKELIELVEEACEILSENNWRGDLVDSIRQKIASIKPLTEEEIKNTGIKEQLWFAHRLGSAPYYMSDEQVRVDPIFATAIVNLVRAMEKAHNIGVTNETN